MNPSWLIFSLFVLVAGCVTVDQFGNPIEPASEKPASSIDQRFNRLLSAGMPLQQQRLNDKVSRPFALALSGDRGVRELSLAERSLAAGKNQIDLLFESLESMASDDQITAVAVFDRLEDPRRGEVIAVHLEDSSGIAVVRLYPFERTAEGIRFAPPRMKAARPMLFRPSGR